MVAHLRDKDIFSVLDLFSKTHGFQYKNDPVPYMPFGKIYGNIDSDKIFRIYIYQTETHLSRRLHTVFSMASPTSVPKGFCIEYERKRHKKKEDINERIIDKSYNEQLVFEFINKICNLSFCNLLDQVDTLESMTFKQRVHFRISDKEISFSIARTFFDIESLNTAFSHVKSLLLNSYKLFDDWTV